MALLRLGGLAFEMSADTIYLLQFILEIQDEAEIIYKCVWLLDVGVRKQKQQQQDLRVEHTK